MRDIDIKWLETFIVAAKYENLRKASEELYITQPAVTKHIQRLEQHVQTNLFEREGKKLILNAAGQRFLAAAKVMLDEYHHSLASLEAWKQGFEQKLIIAAAPQIAASILPQLLKKFIFLFPEIDVQIKIVNSYDVLQFVSEGRADVGLTRLYASQQGLQCDIIFDESVVLVAPYKEIENDEATVLNNYRVITHNHPTYWNDLLKNIAQYYTIQTMEVNQIEVTKRFIEAELAVSYLPQSMIQQELAQKTVCIIEANHISLPTSQTMLITKIMSEEVKKFVAFMKN